MMTPVYGKTEIREQGSEISLMVLFLILGMRGNGV
jgi:hypothetical protein